MRFDFQLARDAPGWADPVVESESGRLQMRASYLTDALGDLLNSLMLLVNGRPYDICDWEEEPGGWRWILVRQTAADVEVTIEFNTDVYADPWRPGPSKDIRYRDRLALVELVGAIAAGARTCLDEFGADGYAHQWAEHPFPRLQLAALERWLASGEAAPLYERE